MRRFTAALAAFGTALGLALVAVSPAEAALTSPANGSIIRGNFTFQGSALGDGGTLCATGEQPGHTFSLINSGGTTVLSSGKINGTGVITWGPHDSHAFPNGTYTARTVERRRTGAIFCGGNNTTVNNSVTIDNITELAFSPQASAPQNTSITVSATLTDPNLGTTVLPGRVVTFSLGGGSSVTGTTNAQGVATATLPINGGPRNTTVSASFAQTSFYKGSSVTKSFEVTKNASTTTVAQPAPVVHGEGASFTATVAPGNGTGTPTGTVQFKVDGNDLGGPKALAGGTATSDVTSSLSTGSHTVTAEYSGDANFFGGTSEGKTQVVNKAETTTTLTNSPPATVAGQAVTFTAHVDVVAPGVGTLGGAVQFNIDGNPFGTAVSLGAGDNATLTVSNLSVGNHDVVAVYNGNADFASSSSAELTHGVGKADTTIDLTSSANPAFSGQPITYTAQVAPVAPGAGTITGTVQFAVDGVDLGAPVPVNGGQAVSPVSHQLVEGSPHVVTANYSGDANFAGGSDSLNQTIVAAQTTTSVTSSPNPSVFGQAVTIHAEVTPNAPATGAPTGFARFVVDGVTADFIELQGGQADLTLSNLAVGDHSIKVVYLSDDLNFFTSTSSTITQTVNKAATKTVVTSSAQPAVYGQPITFTATVSALAPGAGNPSGTITFKDGATTIGTEPVSASTGEQASITVDNLSVGSHAITATYSGDDSFNGSNGNTPQQVTRAQTSVVVASSANPSQSGQGVQFTATVSPVAPGAGDPTGTVRFFVNGANLGSPQPVSGGVATSPNFSSLTPGVYKITATYSGDGNFVGSTGALDQGTGQNVTKGQVSMVVTSSPNPSAYGDAVTISTTVSAVAPAQRKPSGVVQIWEGDELLGATSLAPAAPSNSSETSFVTTGLSAGTHSLTAVYVGNFNFDGSSKTITQTVGAIPTVTGLSSDANPAVYGDTVSFTATVNTAAGTPTGSVTFKEGSTVLGSAPVGDGGQATLAVAGLHAGTHTVKATYTGDVSHSASTSGGYDQVISKAPTTILAADVNNPGDVPLRNGWIRAKLVDRYGNPLAGRSISFDAPPGPARPARHLCDAVTNAQGIAECDTQVISIDIGLDLGNEALLDIHGTYDVTFAGDADTIGDSDRGHQY